MIVMIGIMIITRGALFRVLGFGLCKALSDAYFGSEDSMIRLDMSEYMERLYICVYIYIYI